jgi:cytochrome c oxidase subunit II
LVGTGLGAASLALPPAARAAGNQNVLHPESRPEHAISTLWWVMLAGCSIGFGVIVLLLFLGWARRNRASLPFGGGDRAGTTIVVVLGVFVPIVILSTLFVWSDIFVIRSTAAPPPSSTKLSVQVIGHQWFWEVRYPGTSAVTANEIHIPVKTRVDMLGTTADVIHSFWVPELGPKMDMLPGTTNHLRLFARRAGSYDGQCAEFCGVEHAWMRIRIVVQSQTDFDHWVNGQSLPAPAQGGAGERLFLANICVNCHTIRGTSAAGTAGPDLTHVGARETIGAGVLPNDVARMRAWLADPQRYKPGALMPSVPLSATDLDALAAYLVSLK